MKDRVICGFHAVLARLRSQPYSILQILVDERRQDGRIRNLLTSAKELRVHVEGVGLQRLDSLSGQARHQGVVAVVRVAKQRASLDEVLEGIVGHPFILILDGITDPHNLGACLRVADAAGVHAVIAPKDRSAGIGVTVSKVASGAAETVPYFMVTNLARTLDELKEREIWVVGADEQAQQNLYMAALPEAIAWVMGAEGEGMRRLTRERCDQLVSIPMRGQVSSLNVSVASGICLYESVRRRSMQQIPMER